MEKEKGQKRFWEIDFVRGIAILMMITYHGIFNLYYFGEYGIDINRIGWRILGRSTAVLFITLVGISLTISYSRTKEKKNGIELHLKYILRGVKIFFWGLLISFMTYLFIGEAFIIFGILHFIGVAIIIAYPFVRYRYVPLFLGIGSLILGLYLYNIYVPFEWLLWIGLRSRSFTTLDYFPIFPWIGMVFIGLSLGKIFYPEGKRKFKLPELSDNLFIRKFCFLGKNSLKIYLLHQPVLITLLYIFEIIEIPFL